jgi:predicted amidophosphoribosyltransferase
MAHIGEHFPGTVFDAIIPVPLHRQRLMQREFNQASMFARGLADHLQAPVLEGVLVRVRSTRPPRLCRDAGRDPGGQTAADRG